MSLLSPNKLLSASPGSDARVAQVASAPRWSSEVEDF